MAEYWKSTPKYWCKFCKAYIRDTKFERQQHDATPKHQHAIQRSLRDLHRDREREDREKQRAKDEVARLNGVVAGSSGSSSSADGAGSKGKAASGGPAPPPPRQATVEERKRQLKQLAELGVVVPDEFRREMAMAGEWQTVAVKPVAADPSAAPLNIGVRKRKKEGDEDEDEDEEGGGQAHAKKAGWGNSFKTYPGANGSDPGADIEALLGAGKQLVQTAVKTEPDVMAGPADEAGIKKEEGSAEGAGGEDGVKADPTAEPKLEDIPVKKEEGDGETAEAPNTGGATAVVFKKRKSKALRQK